MRIIITAGHDKSLHAIALMDQLLSRGHQIEACFVVKTFQIIRFHKYLKLYDWKTLKAKFFTHVLNSQSTFLSKEIMPIKGHLQDRNISLRSIKRFCSLRKIRYYSVSNLNSTNSVSEAARITPDLIIYCGGGLLRNDFISTPKYGILNAHSGELPYFRGMNVMEWTLILDKIPMTTIHFIDKGVDTGRILYKENLNVNSDLYTMRGEATVQGVLLLTKVVDHFFDFLAKAKVQKLNEGKQFYVMHPRLKEIVERICIRRSNVE
jgi:methionyl-tRNA formyltransferase